MKHAGSLAVLAAIILPGAPALAAMQRPAPAVILAQAAPPEVCNEIYQPVCATDPAGKRVTYPNACYARRARATNITPGECPK
jgi:Kazal-type serine protease inhibitor domain